MPLDSVRHLQQLGQDWVSVARIRRENSSAMDVESIVKGPW